jgi:co-chaperonin GroES (HSP10)
MKSGMYSPHSLKRVQLIPVKDAVIVSDMVFDERITTGGIVLLNDNGKSNGIRPRWGQVYAVGPEQTWVRPGQWVCVAHGRWTRGVDIEDETGKHTIRKIDPDEILLVSDQKPQDDTMSDAVHVEAKPSWMQHN